MAHWMPWTVNENKSTPRFIITDCWTNGTNEKSYKLPEGEKKVTYRDQVKESH